MIDAIREQPHFRDVDVQFTSIFVGTAALAMMLVTHAQSVPYVEPSAFEDISQRWITLIMPERPIAPPRDEPSPSVSDKPAPSAVLVKPAPAPPKPVVASGRPGPAAPPAKGLVALIGSKGRDGAIHDVFAEGGFEDVLLKNVLDGVQGIDIADPSAGPRTRGRGDDRRATIGDIAIDGGGDVLAGTKREEVAPGDVTPGAPEVEGGDLSSETVARVMKNNLRALKDCYERQLKRFPTLAGKMVLSFAITEDGRTDVADVVEDSMNDATVKRCILDRSRTWHFPKPSGGSVSVSFPLVFAPAG